MDNLKPTDTELLRGYAETTVRRRVTTTQVNGSFELVTETVYLRMLSAADYPALAAIQADEGKCIELYCGKPEGWAAGLLPDDFLRLLQEGERVNASFFPWAARRLKVMERDSPGIIERLQKRATEEVLQRMQAGAGPLLSSSPTPPPAAVPATSPAPPKPLSPN